MTKLCVGIFASTACCWRRSRATWSATHSAKALEVLAAAGADTLARFERELQEEFGERGKKNIGGITRITDSR